MTRASSLAFRRCASSGMPRRVRRTSSSCVSGIPIPAQADEAEYVAEKGARVVFDTLQTTRHLHASFEQGYPEEVRQRVLKNG